jgi:hypothetical protein
MSVCLSVHLSTCRIVLNMKTARLIFIKFGMEVFPPEPTQIRIFEFYKITNTNMTSRNYEMLPTLTQLIQIPETIYKMGLQKCADFISYFFI